MKIRTLAACCGLLLGIAGTAQANLLTNGSFEGGGEGYPYLTITSGETGNTTIPGWTVMGSVDWIDTYWQPQNGSKSLDLAGLYQHGMVVSDPFATTPGSRYRVQFEMAGNPDQPYTKSLEAVYLGDLDPNDLHHFDFIQTGHTRSDMGWQTFFFDFLATDTTSQLAFFDVTDSPYGDNESWGAALDNVSVDPAPVPEPSTMLLLGAGLAGCSLLARRRKEDRV